MLFERNKELVHEITTMLQDNHVKIDSKVLMWLHVQLYSENRQHMLHVFCDLTLVDFIQTCLLPGGSNVLHIVQYLEMYIVYWTL